MAFCTAMLTPRVSAIDAEVSGPATPSAVPSAASPTRTPMVSAHNPIVMAEPFWNVVPSRSVRVVVVLRRTPSPARTTRSTASRPSSAAGAPGSAFAAR